MRRGLGAVLVCTALAMAAGAPAALAQSAKDRTFQALLRDPANPALMLQYSRLAVAEGDYEAAVATLERLLDREPQNQDARYELALAYFALGQNQVAEYHLDLYRTRGQLTEAEAAEAEAFRSSVANRQSAVTTSGLMEGGLIHREADSQTGLTFDLNINLSADLGGAAGATWDTDLGVSVLHFPEDAFEDLVSVSIRSGPVLSLGGTVGGAQLKPYIDLAHVEADDTEVAGSSVAAGLLYTNVIDAAWSVNAEAQLGRVERTEGVPDADYGLLQFGAQYRLGQNTALSGSLRYVDEDEDDAAGGNDVTTTGLSLGAVQNFDGAFLGLGQSWALSGFVRQDNADYDDGRADETLGLGASIMTNLTSTTFLRGTVRSFDRSSSDEIFEDDDILFSLEAGLEF